MKRVFVTASVLGLFAMLGTVTSGLVKADEQPAKDIVDTAVGAGQFKRLVTAVKAAELVETLKGKGPFTVFAPTDEAFAKVPKEKLEALLKDKKALTSVLTYHIVSGKVMAADVVKLDSTKTLEGKSINIVAKDGRVTINGANVLKTDIVCGNGVIHVIDAVLMPPADKESRAAQKPTYYASNGCEKPRGRGWRRSVR